MNKVKLTRRELFDLVWSTPMKALAARFGLSVVRLAKVCERFQIPRPPQGHWARLAWNHEPNRPSLPDTSDGTPDVLVLSASVVGASGRDTAGGPPSPSEPSVNVSEKLATPHPVTTYLGNAARGTEMVKFGRLLVGRPVLPEICVRRASLQRTLVLLNALFVALTERGHVVEMQPWGLPPSPTLTIMVADRGAMRVRVEEKLADKPHIPTADERDKQERWRWKIRKYDQVPEGELIFKVEGANWQFKGRKSWSDTKRQRMEHLLGRVIVTIEEIADFNHKERVKLDEMHRVAEVTERRRRRAERLEQWRCWLATDLEEMATDWQTARAVTEFLDAFEAKVSGVLWAERVTPWLSAARSFAGRLDPLASPESVPKDLDPSDEVLAAFAERRKSADGKREA